MKRIILTLAATAFVAASALAQNTPSSETPSSSQQPRTERSKDWTKVEAAQVPSSVKETLKDDKYKGWESSGIYYNRSTNQYSVDAKGRGDRMDSYTFDASGKAINSPGTTETTQGASGNNPNSGNRPNGSSTPNSSPNSTPTDPNSSRPNR